MVSLAAYIEAQKLRMQMENVVEVIHRQWTVKPVSSKLALRNALSSQPENSITHTHNSDGKLDLDPSGLAGSTAYTRRANGDVRANVIGPTTYIARPHHYQDPHTGTTNTHMHPA